MLKIENLVTRLGLLLALLLFENNAVGQTSCPPNIDFEQGNTNNWLFYTGVCCPISTPTLSGPVATRHTLTFGTATDLYGGFPILAPGGGQYSLKLGNSSTGAQAERARYFVRVPTGVNNYSLIYRYAVVLQNPNHSAADQPRFEVKAYDSATGAGLSCGQFSYVSSSSMPGFSLSSIGSQVYYKSWSTASLDLSGQGGKTIAVDFASGDCDLSGHFGYGYLDLNCSLFQIVSVNCTGAPTTSLSAPPGFQSYHWYNASYTLVGIGQTVNVATPPTTSQYYVVLTPYAGYGCPDTLATTIAVTSLNVNATNDTFVCNTNSIQLNAGASGSSTIFNYSWTPASGLSCTNCATPTANPSSNTTYKVTVTDGNNCTKTDSVKLTVGPFATATSGNVSCYGGANGNATAAATNGLAPYNYTWNTAPVQTSKTISNLPAGAYDVVVTDAHGCMDTASVLISQPPLLQAAISYQNVGCFGENNGSATVSGSGGTPPYTYSWNTSPVLTSATISNLVPGIYIASVTDSKGCSVSDTVTITQPAVLNAAIASTQHVSCNGSADGTATVMPMGGTTPYATIWNTLPQQTTVTATSLAAGSYIATVTDSNGCIDTVHITITEPAALSTLMSTVNVNCHGDSTGNATVLTSGGTTPYNYSWNTTPTQNSFTAVNLSSGIYYVTVTDSNGCTINDTANITQPSSALIAQVNASANVLCYGGNNGTAGVVASGGTLPYSYSWNTSPVQTSATATNLSQGAYLVTVSDSNGCVDTASVFIAQPDSLSLTVTTSDVNCFGANDGLASVVVTGGKPPYSYLWNTTPQQTTSSISNLSQGNYGITVTDDNACSKSAIAVIAQPTLLNVTIITATQVSCNGGNNGTASATASGGTAPYSYVWNTLPTQTTATATNLSAGSYIVTVTDAKGCIDTDRITITQPTVLTAQVTGTSALCFGANTGTATVSVLGGTLPYSYSWNTSPVQTSATATNLSQGAYLGTVSDGNGCVDTASVFIAQPDSLSLTVTTSNVNCFGANDGLASVVVTGGKPPYSYVWNTTPQQTTSAISNLPQGNYGITVTDDNACSKSAIAIIAQPTLLNVTIITATQVSCNGGNNGTASANASGGTAPYSYLWNTLPAQTTATANNLPAGTYIVTVTDAKGCIDTATVTITQPSVLTAQVTGTSALCFGTNTGTATVAALGGTMPYTYSWNTTPVQTTATLSNLPAGNYSVIVTDNLGCIANAGFVITQSPAIIAGISVKTDVSCNGGSTGSATANVTGGAGGFTYTWNTTPIQNTITATGLSAGNYIVTITDSNNCSDTAIVTITQPTALTATASTTNPVCFGDTTGTAAAVASGGTAPYTYTWNTIPAQNGGIANNLPAGIYTAAVTDSKGCTTNATATVSQPPQLTVSISSKTDITCFGFTNGTAVATASGGTAPYSFLWSTTPAQNSNAATGLPQGQFSVTATDGNGCIKSTSVIINDAPPLLTNIINVASPKCYGGNDGSATISASGGKPPYNYLWSTNPPVTTPTVSNLPAGNFTVTVTDSNGCIQTDSIQLTQPSDLTISTGFTPTCEGRAEGRAYASVSGGTAPYSLLWSNAQTTDTIKNLTAGSYNLTVNDANNCSKTVTVLLQNYPRPMVDAGADQRICAGARMQLLATGATNYFWYPATGLSCTSCADPVVTGDTNIVYAVTGTNGFNCSDTDEITISVVQRVPTSVGDALEICEGEEVQLSATGGIAYNWAPSGSLSNNAISNPLARATETTVYTVIITQNECFKDTLEQKLTVYPLPSISLGPDIKAIAGAQITLNPQTTNANSIAWTPPANLSCTDCFNPVATMLESITYTATVTNELGCTTSDDIKITVTCDNSALFIPNTFTPNGDGNNETFFASGKGISIINNILIYNRWGQMVFEAINIQPNDPLQGWDGKYKGEQLPSDVFVYMMEAQCTTGETIKLTGDVTLLR